MFERDRNFVNLSAPGLTLAAGDQTWSLSYLTESGHYGRGFGGHLESRHWSAGAFADIGRRDVRDGSQVGASVGLSSGRVFRISLQYLARFADGLNSARLASLKSARVILTPIKGMTADVEAGIGHSAAGRGYAVSERLAFNARRISIYGRHVRKDGTYPLRDRTGLLDSAGLTVRPFGKLQFQGSLDGTTELNDLALAIDAPTRRRLTRARLSWGSSISATVSRIAWTRPGGDWTSQWRKESATLEVRRSFGPVSLSPGIERGTEATPVHADTAYSLGWLQARVRINGLNSFDARLEYGRGIAGDPKRTVRRVSLGAALQPLAATRLMFRIDSTARDAVWLQGSKSAAATLDQSLPWRHHILVNYQRRSGAGAFLPDSAAVRIDYVVPIGLPARPMNDSGRLTVRFHQAGTGQPRVHMLVKVNGESRLTDADGVAAFTNLKPGAYHVTVAPDSLEPDEAVVPAFPLRLSIKGGGHVQVGAEIVRTGAVNGILKLFHAPAGPALRDQAAPLTPGPGLANAVIELLINDEHRSAVTDAQGRFTFEHVPPGTWLLRVVRADIPPFYFLEDAQMTMVLAPGQSQRLIVRVVPKGQSW
jgi:hypothetical protein